MLCSVLCRRTFRLPYRYSHAVLTDPQTQYNTPDNELHQSVGCHLQDLTNDSEDRTEEYGLPATQPVRDQCAREGSDEGSDLERGNDSTLAGGIVCFERSGRVNGVDLGEGLHPTLESRQGANTGLVVSKDYEGRGTYQSHLGQCRAFPESPRYLGDSDTMVRLMKRKLSVHGENWLAFISTSVETDETRRVTFSSTF